MVTKEFMLRVLFFALVALLPEQGSGVSMHLRSQQGSQVAENPIRDVVRLLQKLSKSLIQEGKDCKVQYDKVMCSCKIFQQAKRQAIQLNKESLRRLQTTIDQKNQQILLLEADIERLIALRKEAEDAVAAAEALRFNQHEEFKENSAFAKQNVIALKKAIKAIEDGHAGKLTGGSFLQSDSLKVLRKLSISATMSEGDRDVLGAFLSTGSKNDDGDDYSPGGDDYAPQSGEILGILKQLYDGEKKDLDEMIAAEEEAVRAHKELMAAKAKEIADLTSQIDDKSQRKSDLKVSLVGDEANYKATEKILTEDELALSQSIKVCRERDRTYQEGVKNRYLELGAIADAVKMLNEDDALDLFKKSTLDKNSFFQIHASRQAVSMLQTAQQSKVEANAQEGESLKSPYFRMNLLSLVVKHKNKGVDFHQLHQMIDDQVEVLRREELLDNRTKDSCEDRKKSAAEERAALEARKKKLQGQLDASNEYLALIQEGLDYANGNLTETNETLIRRRAQRQADYQQYIEQRDLDTQAKELIEKARNRLYKFYNPELYEAPDQSVVSDDDITAAADFLQVSSQTDAADFLQVREDPGEVKEYKKSDQFSGISGLMEDLVTDLKKSLANSKVNDDNDQSDFEKFESAMNAQMQNYIDKIKALKQEQSDEMENNLNLSTEMKICMSKLKAVIDRIGSLKKECDWFLSNYQKRLEARYGEIQALHDAKEFFMGASAGVTFLQTKIRRSLGL